MTSTTHSLSNPTVDSPKPAAAARAADGFALGLPPRPALLSRRAWLALIALCIAIGIGVPLAALVAPESSAFHLSAYAMTLTGKLMCYAIAALALDLVWGYCGILSLGHGLFFALGGYAIGMYLMREIGRDGKYGSDLPDFMVFLDWHQLPWYWSGTQHLAWALALVVLVPAVLAWVFGFFTFRSRVKGVYLSIITQAMTFAAMLLFYRNETGFGGNNGFTDFKRIAGFAITSPGNSIEMAIWVAVGGRGTLIGPIVGAFAVNGAKSLFTAYFAEYWLFFLGLIFVLVPLLLPRGIMGLVETVLAKGKRA